MLKIEFDPSTLSKSQREDLASFILGWDAQSVMTVSPVTSGTIEPGAKLVVDGKVIGTVSDVPGVINPPKPAPLSADAGQSSTAPVDTQVNTSTGIAPPPPVPQPGFPANTAVPQSPNLAEVDSKGMPWDARIHSSSKAKVADGSWKYRRGVSDEEVKRVEAELHNPTLEELFTEPTPASATNTQFDQIDLSLPLEKFVKPVSGIAPPPTVSNIVNTLPLPPRTSNEAPTNLDVDLRKEFAQLMIRVAQAKGAGKITTEEVTAALAAHAVPSLPMLSTKLDLVPSVAAAIDEIIASRG